jgi:hypothetical protein
MPFSLLLIALAEIRDSRRYSCQEHRRTEVFEVNDRLGPVWQPLTPVRSASTPPPLRANGIGNGRQALYRNTLSLDRLLAYAVA